MKQVYQESPGARMHAYVVGLFSPASCQPVCLGLQDQCSQWMGARVTQLGDITRGSVLLVLAFTRYAAQQLAAASAQIQKPDSNCLDHQQSEQGDTKEC